jgi:hypothetical protein
MSTPSPQPFGDTMTMLWRNILHNLRAPSGAITVIGVPLIFLLLFVYVFGETLGAGLMTGGTILITVSIAALLGFALLLGYRPQADALDWLALAGLVVVVGFALAWLSVALGLAAKRPDTASNLPLLLMILPLLTADSCPSSRSPAGCGESPSISRSRPSSAPSAASSPAPPRDAMRHGPSVGPSRSPSSAMAGRCGSTAATPRRRCPARRRP